MEDIYTDLTARPLCSRRVLGITESISDLGGMQWELLATLVMAWLVVYLIIMKGLHASGKVTWTDYCTDI